MTEYLTFEQLTEANPQAAEELVEYWAEQGRTSKRLARVTIEESGEAVIRCRDGELEFLWQYSGEYAVFDREKGWWCYRGSDGWPKEGP